jgi:hypothetical protein
MDELREMVAGFETDNDPLPRNGVEAARAVLRHDQRDSESAAHTPPQDQSPSPVTPVTVASDRRHRL